MNIFNLAAALTLNKDDYEEGLNDAEKEASSFGSKLKSGLGTAAKVTGVALAATATGATVLMKSFMSGTKEAAEYGDNIDKMSQKLGISAEAFQEWDFILQHSGSSIESMKPAIKTLTAAAYSNNEAFRRLGITQEQLASMSNEELFSATITALQGVTDESERSALASELLGKSAMEMGALLNTSAEDTEAMRQQVHELGGVMSDEAVKAAAQYQDAMQNLHTAADGLKRNLMQEFLPGISSVAEGLADIFSGKGDQGLGKISAGIDNVIKGLKTALPKFTKAVTEIIKAILKAIKDNLPQLLDAITDALVDIIDMIVDNLPMFVDMVLTIVEKMAQALIKSLPQIIQAAFQLFTGIIKAIPKIVVEIVKAMPQIIGAIVGGLLSGIASIGEAVGQLFGIVPSEAEKAAASMDAFLGDQVAKLNNFRSALEGVNPQLADYTQLLSEEGRTMKEIETEAGEHKDKITEILGLALQEHRALRDQEILDIQEHQRKLRELQEEELGIYQQQLRNEYTKIVREAGDLSAQETQQYIVNIDAALNKANEYVDELYNAKLTELANLKAAGTLTEAEYAKQVEDAGRYYDGLKTQNASYYDEAVQVLLEKQSTLTESVKGNWEKLGQSWSQANIMKVWDEEGAKGLKGLVSDWESAMSDVSMIHTNEWLNIIAATVANGQMLDDETRGILTSILDAWESMPEGLREKGGEDMIRAVIAGMEEHIPELKNASNLSADAIIKVLRKRFYADDFVFIGQNITQGVTSGMENERSALEHSARGLARAALNAMKNVLGIHSPSRVFKDIIGKNIVLGLAEGLDKYAFYATDAMEDLGNSLTVTANADASKNTDGGIKTPGGPSYSIVQNVYATTMTPTQAFEEAQNAFLTQQFLGMA